MMNAPWHAMTPTDWALMALPAIALLGPAVWALVRMTPAGGRRHPVETPRQAIDRHPAAGEIGLDGNDGITDGRVAPPPADTCPPVGRMPTAP
ncbi:MAG: hypothetical protein KDC33_05635 [Thermoleophilia bacterium]|nr:hypothetical protein [Thermoleophilia bacterium]